MYLETTKKQYKENLIIFVKKKYVFVGIVFLMIIIMMIFCNFLTLNTFYSHVLSINQLNQSIEIIITQSILTTTMITTEILKSTIRKHDGIICNNSSNISSNLCGNMNCVIILRVTGGRLGNYMFRFASAYGLARTHHCRLYVSDIIRNELKNNFQMNSIDEKIWLNENELKHLKNIQIKDSVCSFRSDVLRINEFQIIELYGYWQSYLHFDAYREEIREIFTAHNDTLKHLVEYFNEITKNIHSSCSLLPFGTHQELRQAFRTCFNITWIGIHIRRTDFLRLGYASDTQYIYRAMNFYYRRYYQKDIRFLVTSDDRTYCREIFINEEQSQRVFILPNHFSKTDDLMALSFCHHSIITGGTFGFWAGYLTGGEVIHDIKYKSGCSRVEYYPPWFLLVGALPEENKQS